jgi:hypothetical protein
MTWMRRRLRLAVIAWLVCQVAAVSAVPLRDCCQDHQRPKAVEPGCHGKAAPAHAAHASHGAPAQCPMKAANGTACPMHRSPAPASGKTCVMKGTCETQVAMLASLFFVPGVVPEIVELDTPDGLNASLGAPISPEPGRPFAPDPPPPRADLAI